MRTRVLALLAVAAFLLASVGPAVAVETSDTTPPAPVTGLNATSGAGHVSVAWNSPKNAGLAGVLLVRRTGTVAPAHPW